MTWNELQLKIASMPESQRANPAVYLEPYDEGAEMYEIELHEAVIADDRLHKGDFFLQ